MKFLKKRDYNGSIRKVWSDDKEVCFGVVGTVGDLLKEGIFESADYSPETWAFLPAPGVIQKPWFGETREAALANLPKGNSPVNADIIERLRASGWHNDFLYFMGLLPSPCPDPFSGTVREVARS